MMPALLAVDPTISLPLTSPVFWLGMAALAVPAIISSLNGLLSIIARFKKLPADQDRYAAKSDLEQCHSDLDGRIKEERRLREKLETEYRQDNDRANRQRESVQKELQSISNQLGQLFGILNTRRKTGL